MAVWRVVAGVGAEFERRELQGVHAKDSRVPEGATSKHRAEPRSHPRSGRPLLAIVLSALFIGVILAGTVVWIAMHPGPLETMRFTIAPGELIGTSVVNTDIAISPDDATMVLDSNAWMVEDF